MVGIAFINPRADPDLFELRFTAPQPLLWPDGAVEWHLVQRLPDYARGAGEDIWLHVY